MKSWLVQKQTALGKDKSNPLTVDSLRKTIWSSIHHLLINEVLTIPGQTTTGKEISYPFTAGSESPLLGVNTPRSDEDRLELMKLMVFLLPKVEKVGIGVNAVDLQVYAVRHMLLLLVHKLLLFSLTNWCSSLSVVSPIKYALTVNPNIYVSCINQFWTTVAVKQVNDITRLQALVDRKNVVVTEAMIREALHLDDSEGVDCLPNKEIFVDLVRNVDSTTKFYMYPRFLQLIIRNQVERATDEHVEEVDTCDATQGDDSAAHGEVPTLQQTPPQSPQVQLPLPQPQPQPQQAADFPMSLLQEAMDAYVSLTRRVEHLEYDKVAQALEITKLKRRVKKLEKSNKVRVLKLRRLQKVGTSQRVEIFNDTVMDDESNQGRMIAEMDQDDAVVLKDDKEIEDAIKVVEEAKEDKTEPAEVQEVVDVVTTAKLITKVVTAASETVTAASAIITTTEARVYAATTATLTTAPVRVAVAPSRRRKGVVIKDPKEESTTSTIIPAETKSKDKGKGILVEEPKPLKKKQQIEMDEQYARELHAELNKDIDWDKAIDHNVDGFKMDYFKGMSYDDIRPIFEAKFNSNVALLLKTKEQIEKDENRALEKINETPVERAAKRRKLDEEVEDLKRHLQIVPNEDDDVYTEATLLARKVLVVDYEIIEINNKPYYKIIRADGTHQLYISFLTLLRNFDRENLEAL
nr:hypothetical protein [Tanacetum cinerariifolium]